MSDIVWVRVICKVDPAIVIHPVIVAVDEIEKLRVDYRVKRRSQLKLKVIVLVENKTVHDVDDRDI